MDPITIGGAWTATKEIFNTGKRIFELKISDEVRKEVQSMIDKTSELYDKIVLLEEERQSNRQLISELKAQIKKLENFDDEIKSYKPCKLESGSLVYEFQTSKDNPKPPHYICTKCVSNSVISILQPKDRAITEYICHCCDSTYVFKQMRGSVYIG